MSTYNFRFVEQKWQDLWKSNNAFKTPQDAGRKKAYILEMLPYPSGKLHMGHVRNYAIGDAIARFMKQKGFNVLHPMGWDAFGLPAENAAIERNAHPKTWTYENIEAMRQQLMALGFSYDWDREIATCSPEYYGHEQKIFLDFYQKGLAYRTESWVNWDPIENTVLANEQVVDGRGWRSGAIVEKRKLNQWSLKITDYAQELLDDLGELSGWPEKVLKMQENWIGRSEGAEVHFKIDGGDGDITVFTTRPDTLFGAAFVAIAAAHPIAEKLSLTNSDVKNFVLECQQTSTAEADIAVLDKKGIATGIYVEHPFDSTIKLPVYIANFVLMEYGTGALFGCPAHDERDFELATKYSLPILPVVTAENAESLPYTGDGVLINSSFLTGMSVADGKKAAIEALQKNGRGVQKISYRLRDWGISRQRYWGCPIPFIHCDDCGVVPVPESGLPVLLPDDISFEKPGNPLDHHPTWKHTTCPKCQKAALRETDTFDTFFESSWYYLRYISPKSANAFDTKDVNEWMPVDWYIGGVEHAVLHLLYARFFTKALRDVGYHNIKEPFKNLLTQGMVCHQTYQSEDGRWLYPDEVERDHKGIYVAVDTKKPVVVGPSIKMSKSKRNTVDPQYIVDTYGADVARMFVLSDTPPDRDFDWSDDGLEGAWRYLNKLSRLMENLSDITNPNVDRAIDEKVLKHTHQYLQKIEDAYARRAFNKVLSFHRELVKIIEDDMGKLSSETINFCSRVVLQLIEPITPHFAHEHFEKFSKESLQNTAWIDFDPALAVNDTVTIAVQVNGKLRGAFDCAVGLEKNEVIALAKALPAVQNFLMDQTIKKEIVVPNKIVSFVI
jgi:leucyl-tRNA synthetase